MSSIPKRFAEISRARSAVLSRRVADSSELVLVPLATLKAEAQELIRQQRVLQNRYLAEHPVSMRRQDVVVRGIMDEPELRAGVPLRPESVRFEEVLVENGNYLVQVHVSRLELMRTGHITHLTQNIASLLARQIAAVRSEELSL